MKRPLHTILALAALGLCLACGGNPNGLPMAEVLKTDSIGCEINDSHGSVHVSADFAQVPIIAEWMSEQLNGTYEGDYLDGDAMMKFYANELKQSLLDEQEEDIDDEYYEAHASELTSEIHFKKECETEKFVTYTATTYFYAGGAHGSTLSDGQTFRKQDGRRIGSDIFQNLYSDELQGMMKDGLRAYFEVETDEQLQECFLNPDHIYLVPFPQQPPIFVADGIRFVYQQYEIAAYAYGLPTFTLPYDRVRPLLNVTGLRLLPED